MPLVAGWCRERWSCVWPEHQDRWWASRRDRSDRRERKRTEL